MPSPLFLSMYILYSTYMYVRSRSKTRQPALSRSNPLSSREEEDRQMGVLLAFFFFNRVLGIFRK